MFNVVYLIRLSQRNDINITNIHLAQTNGNISIINQLIQTKSSKWIHLLYLKGRVRKLYKGACF
jgi:large exoprotein involved in heme utilization and adhesion